MSFEERLIELVKARPTLYSRMDENHKNIYIKEKLWNEISKQLGVNVKRSKSRWKTLRNTFRVELAKNTNSATGVRRTIWRYYDLMMFLKDEVVTDVSYNLKKFRNSPVIDEVIATTQSESIESTTQKKEYKEPQKKSQILSEKDELREKSQFFLEKEILQEKSHALLEKAEKSNSIIFMNQKGDQNKTAVLTDERCLQKEERNETAVFMESMVIKISKANLSFDELDELQEAVLSLINTKLREFRQKKTYVN